MNTNTILVAAIVIGGIYLITQSQERAAEKAQAQTPSSQPGFGFNLGFFKAT